MKLITFVVPCYNSAKHMEKCLDSLPLTNPDCEIIIVNDGSSDRTGEIADRYQVQYPSVVTAVHQQNGGHGEGVNQGLERATGLFFKVVDSDDWMDQGALETVLDTMYSFQQAQVVPDMIFCNYARIHQRTGKVYVARYHKALPANQILRWEDTKRFGIPRSLMMHAIFYQTAVLRACSLVLPKHTFYVDCLVTNLPLYYVKTLYYLDVTPYQYLVGQATQSVNKTQVIRNINHMERVVKAMIHAHAQNAPHSLHPKQERLILEDIRLIVVLTCAHMMLANKPEILEQKAALEQWIKAQDRECYQYLRRAIQCRIVFQNSTLAMGITRVAFATFNQIYKAN